MSDIGIEQLVFVGGKGVVIAFDRFDGRERWIWDSQPDSGWVARLGTPAYLSVVLDADRLVVANAKGVWCLDPLTDAEVWKVETTAFRGGYPVIAGGGGDQGGNAAAAATAASSGTGAGI